MSEADQMIYSAAFEQAQAKRFENAHQVGRKAVNELPAKVLIWLDLKREGTDADFATLTRFLDENPDWPRQRNLRRNAERAMPGDLPDAELLSWFEEHPPVTIDGALRFVAALERSGRQRDAVDQLRDVWIDFDFTSEQENTFYKKFRKKLRQKDQIARLDRLLWQRSARAARRQARRIGGGYVELAEARLLLAYRRPGVDRAVRRVPSKLRDDPGFIYDRARWRHRKGRYEGVTELLDPPIADAPYPEIWWPLRRRTARVAVDKKDYALAYRLASHHGFKNGLGFAEGEWLAGWVALRFLKSPKQAYQHFVRLYEGVSTPVSRSRGAYWAGEAARGKGDLSWAKHWFRLAAQHATTYYGQLAMKRLGLKEKVYLPFPDEPKRAERVTFNRKELVQVVRLLGQLQQENLQAIFLDRLRLDANRISDFQLVAELALEQSRPDRALRTAKEARSQGLILPDHLYPTPTLPASGDLDPSLMLSVIRQESQFYNKVVSSAGARGLMQLMPGTAKAVAKRLKLPYRRARLTQDPTYNIRLGAAYLAGLLDRYDGSRLLSLAAYNAGPHRVDRWLKEFGDPRQAGIDPVDWAERIPFGETRNYVQRILESVPIYRWQLSGGDPGLPLDWATAGFPDEN